jgi:hypothetical protein
MMGGDFRIATPQPFSVISSAARNLLFRCPISDVRSPTPNPNYVLNFWFSPLSLFRVFPSFIISSTHPRHFERPLPSFRAQREICFFRCPISDVRSPTPNPNYVLNFWFSPLSLFRVFPSPQPGPLLYYNQQKTGR